jgi:hypothetical protein
MKHYLMKLDGDSVRFTPDGRIAVVDAIKALSARKSAECIWESLKEERPEFGRLCQSYSFQENKAESVVDGEAWEKIEDALLDYIILETEDTYGKSERFLSKRRWSAHH